MSDLVRIFDFIGHLAAMFVLALMLYALLTTPTSHDDSDPPNGRSGVAVVTDAKTGMQYLKTSGGGITPRLDENGNHMRVGK